MGELSVNMKIEFAQPSYTPKDFADVELWLKTNIMENLPQDVSATYTWSNQTTITANLVFSWTKAEFLEADFEGMKEWIHANIESQLPSNANMSYHWTVHS